ncbi:hypothetical protein [Rhizobium sp. CNPSo 3490]|uniref:DUF7338 family protein n=1 Tax=Rhizobium sp. CNPSo 3490 TaxID=3021407 RepID=UPI00254CE12C|nr:hypothetical protein [Rhizobium sp. CNPSo 3490]MDK4736023.1 hypothetical protein [Rhizobium sp. CNPSo 3490]
MSKPILRYIAYLPVNLALVGLAYLLSSFLAAWSMKHGPVLPGRWRWFSTLNADLDGVEDTASAFTVKRNIPLLFGFYLPETYRPSVSGKGILAWMADVNNLRVRTIRRAVLHQ